MNHRIAHRGALAAGVPVRIVQYLSRYIWASPRFCVVQGVPPPHAVFPCTGLPAGDPCSPSVLAYVLGPWSRAVQDRHEIQAFLYVDDRTLIQTGEAQDEEEDSLARALRISKWVDGKLGLVEHEGKRQMWNRLRVPAARVEHLGIATVPGDTSVPAVRSSEDDLCHLAAAVKCLPGGILVRERLLAGLVLPKVLWSAPLVPAVSAEVAKAFFRSIRGPCTWWCKGRIWADRISLHPQFAAAFACLRATRHQPVDNNSVLRAVTSHHASQLELQVLQDTAHGVLLRAQVSARAQVANAVRAVSFAQGRHDECFTAAADDGHGLRVVARSLALSSVVATRADAEGCERIDIEAQSHPLWKRWQKGLSGTSLTNLAIFQGGAIKTRTRRFWGRSALFCECPCGHPVCSARRLFQECPRLSQVRCSLQQQHMGLGPLFGRQCLGVPARPAGSLLMRLLTRSPGYACRLLAASWACA